MGNERRSGIYFAFFAFLFFKFCDSERSVYQQFVIDSTNKGSFPPGRPINADEESPKDFFSANNNEKPSDLQAVRGNNWVTANQRGSNTNRWVSNSGFDDSKKDAFDRNNHKSEKNPDNKWSNNWNFGSDNKAPQTEGYGNVAFASPPKKNQGNQWSDDNSNGWDAKPDRKTPGSEANAAWGSGKEESQTEGLQLSQTRKPIRNQWNTNSNWNTGSDPKKNHGGSSNSNWNVGFQPDVKTEGYSQSLPSQKEWNSNAWNPDSTTGKKPGPGSGASNGWSSNQNRKKPGSGGSNGNDRNPNENQKRPTFGNQNSNDWSSSQNQKNPESDNSNTNAWNSNQNQQKDFASSKPGKFENTNTNWNADSNRGSGNSYGKKPSRPQSGPESTWNEKPSSTPQVKPHKKVDWAIIEKENKEGKLTLDLSQLWPSSDRRPDQRGSSQRPRGRKRHIPTELETAQCHCANYNECHQNDQVDITNVFKNGWYHLRGKVAECAINNEVCCIGSPRPSPQLLTKRNELTELGAQDVNLRPSCGKRVFRVGANEINEGDLANYGSFPWVLRMVTVENDYEKTLCSASLIHRSIAMTTASCALLLSGEKVRVRAGEWNVLSGHERNSIQESKIGKIFLHPEFDFVNYTNDLALVFLEQGFDFSLNMNTVCLPSTDDVWDISRCVIVTWTKQDEQGMELPLLRKINLETIKQGICDNDQNIKRTRNLKNVDERYICAHSRDVIPCLDDAGASLMCPLYNSDILIQIGFSHQAKTCNAFEKTATFTDILDSVRWISHMEGIYFLAKTGLI